MVMKQIIAFALLIGFAVYELWTLINILRYGGITLIEPNKAMLYTEIGAMVAVIIWGINCLKR